MTDAPTPRETADHAELAAMKPEDHRVRAVMMACESRMKGYETPIHAADAKFALDYLLSEIAALRGERDGLRNRVSCLERLGGEQSTRVMEQATRAKDAERQRDELRKVLEPSPEMIRVGAWRAKLHREANPGDSWEDTAREVFTIMVAASDADASANQGAEQ